MVLSGATYKGDHWPVVEGMSPQVVGLVVPLLDPGQRDGDELYVPGGGIIPITVGGPRRGIPLKPKRT